MNGRKRNQKKTCRSCRRVYVAGTTHIEGIEELEPHLNNDDRLEFFREPDNRYDKQAIVIKTFDGVKIGYVPKQDNVIFARLMDVGKLLFGKTYATKHKPVAAKRVD